MAIDIAAVTDNYVLNEVSGRKNTAEGAVVWNTAMVALTAHTWLSFVNQALLGSRVWAYGAVKVAVLASS